MVEELSWLRTTSTLMAACHEEQEVMDRAYQAIREGLGFDRVGVFLIRDHQGRPAVWEAIGTDGAGNIQRDIFDAFLDDPELPIHSPDFAWLLAGNPYYYCPDRWALTPPEFRAALGAEMHEQVVVVLRRTDQVLGFLSVDNALSGRTLPESRAEILVTFAQQISIALENARLATAEREARARTEALLRASQTMNGTLDLEEIVQVVTTQAMQALRGRSCEAYLYDESGTSTVAAVHAGFSPSDMAILFDSALASAPPQEIAAEREMLVRQGPLVIDPSVILSANPEMGARNGTTARLLVPLAAEEGGTRAILGALYINYSGRSPASISDDEIDLACALASHATTALVKARLYAAERERATRLEELDRMRREFVATVSHELRTPLTGILGFTEMLIRFWDRLDEERRLGALDNIMSAAQRLERLVRDLLLTARLDDPRFSIRMVEIDLGGALSQAVGEVRAKYSGQSIGVQAPESGPTARADPERVAQILVNLLDNAVKYSPEGSPVAAGIDRRDAYWRIWVRDRGPGLTPTELERLFSRFGKLGHRARRAGGHGPGPLHQPPPGPGHGRPYRGREHAGPGDHLQSGAARVAGPCETEGFCRRLPG